MKNEIIKHAAGKSMLIKESNFEKTLALMRSVYKKAWVKQLKKGAAQGLRFVKNLPESISAFGKKESDLLLNTLAMYCGGQAMKSALYSPVLNLTEVLMNIGAKEAFNLKKSSPSVVFDRPDIFALDVVQQSNLFWVDKHWDGYTLVKFREILEDYFDEGMTRVELIERLGEDFAHFAEKGTAYWDLLADHCATKTREIGRVKAYINAGIEYVIVRAYKDDNTTDMCLAMDGKRIRVGRLQGQAEKYLEATKKMDAEKAKSLWIMGNNDLAERIRQSDRLPDGIGSPPYHFRCRTTTVADI